MGHGVCSLFMGFVSDFILAWCVSGPCMKIKGAGGMAAGTTATIEIGGVCVKDKQNFNFYSQR